MVYCHIAFALVLFVALQVLFMYRVSLAAKQGTVSIDCTFLRSDQVVGTCKCAYFSECDAYVSFILSVLQLTSYRLLNLKLINKCI